MPRAGKAPFTPELHKQTLTFGGCCARAVATSHNEGATALHQQSFASRSASSGRSGEEGCCRHASG